MRDVIVCLPGITGSVLQKDGKDVWNVSGGAVLNALRTLGHSIDELELREDSPTVEDLGDGVTAPAVIRDVHLIPGLWKIDGYTKLVDHIETTFDVTRGRNLFEFPYDWRRDNRAAAHRLARQSADWLARWRAWSGARDAKLVLVGHSMGGLVARYFLECLEGWRDTRVLVTFGTPYRGSLNAVDTLANGHKLLFFDLSRLARSFTAVYQLLPIYPCYDAGDGSLVRIAEATITNIDHARAQASLDFHHEIRDAVAENANDEEYVRNRYDIRPVVGITQPTAQSAVRHGDAVELLNRHGDEDLGGDGTVPRASATPLEIEHEANAMYAAERHASLQNDDHVLLQLAGILSGTPIDTMRYSTVVPRIGLALDVNDAYPAAEPIAVRVRPEARAAGQLVVRVADVASDAEVTRAVAKTDADGWSTAEIGPLPEGAYRLTALGEGAVEPVTDVVTVLNA